MNAIGYAPTLAAVLLLAACNGVSTTDPKEAARIYAEREGLIPAENRLHSLQKFRNGSTSVFDGRRRDEYANNLISKLEGKEYWEACYRPIGDVLGGLLFLHGESGVELVDHLSWTVIEWTGPVKRETLNVERNFCPMQLIGLVLQEWHRCS